MDVRFLFPFLFDLLPRWLVEMRRFFSDCSLCDDFSTRKLMGRRERWDYSYRFMSISCLNAPETAQRYIFREQAVFRLRVEEVQCLSGLFVAVPLSCKRICFWQKFRLLVCQPSPLQQCHWMRLQYVDSQHSKSWKFPKCFLPCAFALTGGRYQPVQASYSGVSCSQWTPSVLLSLLGGTSGSN